MEACKHVNAGKIILRTALLILSLLFAAVVYVWITSFGGEFLIIARRKWILVVFAILLVIGPVSGLASVFSEKAKPCNLPSAVRIFFAVWNPVAGIILLFLFSRLFMWVVDTMSIPELTALSLPFIGYGALLVIDGAVVIFNFFKNKNGLGGIPGMIPAGGAFLFVLGAFALTIIFWNPAYAPGIKPVWLFEKGMQDGRGYRIPSMITFKDDKDRDIVLAFAESRKDEMFDWGDIDLVLRRSVDGGKTWGPVQVLLDAGKHTAGNPCPVFDRDTKTLWLPYCIDNKQVWMMKSTDFGQSFSKPVDITKELDLGLKCNNSQLCMEYGTGPGIGIQLRNSRLVVPAYYFGPSHARGAHVIYSDDHGVSWRKGEDMGTGEEPQAFEMTDGTLDMNCRYRRCQPRQTGLSRDGGQTWFDINPEKDLVCAETQASIIRYAYKDTAVLFSNPAGCARGNMTVRLSNDDGRTWPVKKEIYNGPSCYSQLCVLPDGDILLLFEAGKYDYRQGLVLVRLNLNQMLK